MPTKSQRNVSVSAGDAAVLIRAMNRQRAEDARPRTTGTVERFVPKTRPEAPVLHMHQTGAVEDVLVLPRHTRTSGARVVELAPEERSRTSRNSSRSGRRRGSAQESEARRAPERSHRRREANPKPKGLVGRFAALESRTRVRLAIVAGVVALIAFFYGPTADLYAAARDHGQLVQKVAATQAVADELEERVHRLQTEDGIMEEARIRGYARRGEVAVDARELLGIEDTVTLPELSKPIETEEPPLYIRMLDVLMGYEERTT